MIRLEFDRARFTTWLSIHGRILFAMEISRDGKPMKIETVSIKEACTKTVILKSSVKIFQLIC